jgi:hypothetical protein
VLCALCFVLCALCFVLCALCFVLCALLFGVVCFVTFFNFIKFITFYLMEQLNMFSLELLEQKKTVEEEYTKLQSFIDDELEDTTFIYCPDSQYVLFISDIFGKQKRQMEKDVTTEQNQEVILEAKGSQWRSSFVLMIMEQQTETTPHLK